MFVDFMSSHCRFMQTYRYCGMPVVNNIFAFTTDSLIAAGSACVTP